MSERLPHLVWREVIALPHTEIWLFVQNPTARGAIRAAGKGRCLVSTRAGEKHGSVARIREWETLEDGIDKIVLDGVARARLTTTHDDGTVTVDALPERPADAALVAAARSAMEELYAQSHGSRYAIIERAERPPFAGDIATLRETTDGVAYSFKWSECAGATDEERAKLLDLDTDERLRFAADVARARLAWLAALLRS